MIIEAEIENADLVNVANLTAATVFTPNGGDPLLDRIRAEVRSKEYDVSTEKGRKYIASMAYKVARSKTALDNLGKEYVTTLKELPKVVDAERKRLREEFEALQAEVRKPLDEFEAKEAERVAAHEAAIEDIGILNLLTGSSDDVREMLESVKHKHVDRDFQEFQLRADKRRSEAVSQLESTLELTLAIEEAQAEAARIEAEEAAAKLAEREAQIAKDAAERARREAEE